MITRRLKERSLTVYLEYGSVLPYNGAELIYVSYTRSCLCCLFNSLQLDAVYPQGIYFTIAFAGFFIAIANTTGNAIAFANFVMLAATAKDDPRGELDVRIVHMIAIVIVAVVCLIHAIFPSLGLFLNKLLALYKLLLMILIVLVAGIVYGSKHPKGSGKNDFGDSNTTQPGTSNFTAIIYVLYSYTGWENANYVRATELTAVVIPYLPL